MRALLTLTMLFVFAPLVAIGSETSKLYYSEANKAEQQWQKSYYIKESVKSISSSPRIIRVAIKTIDVYRGNRRTAKSTVELNCDSKQQKTIKHWSSNSGEDKGLIVDGEWRDVSGYYGGKELVEQVCPH